MQFLKLSKSATLAELSKIVGDRNIDRILAANNLKRSPNIGKQFSDLCKQTIQNASKEVDWQTKATILNTFTGDADVFEAAALLDAAGWKLMAAAGTFVGRLKIPETISLPDSVDVIGGSNEGVMTVIYKKVMDDLNSLKTIRPDIFNEYSSSKYSQIKTIGRLPSDSGIYTAFKLPWGKITLYSSLSDSSMDFPVYPEDISDKRTASYTTMPDTLYQYEPWQVYSSSGPRSNSYRFCFHRDMWTGDPRDGKANELIRFCEANCYPRYDGSAVNTSTVSLYINGRLLISGVMTDVSTKWSGPLGIDDWYLECELEISITEVSTTPLNFDTMKSMSLIGGQ